MKRMNHLLTRPTLRGWVLALAVTALASCVARAVPYASCITNTAGTISYYLNEAANDVKVSFNGGASTTDLGAQTRGLHSFSLGNYTSYAIVVSNSTPAGWLKTSDDSNTLLQFNYGRGITVNYHPKDTRLFGRIYIANAYSAAGTATNVNLHTVRTLTQGLYALNADQSDALGQGNTGKKPTGIAFSATSGSDPYKIAVGKNDANVYVNTYASADSTTWSVDGDLGTATQVLYGTGSNAVHYCYINSPVVTGTTNDSTMTLWGVEAEKAGHYCQIAQWVIGGGPLPWNTVPNFLGWCDKAPSTLGVADVVTDIDLGADGKVFTSCNRSDGTGTASIRVYDTDGTTALWNSLSAGGSPDVMRMCRAIQISPDGTMLAAVRDTGEFQVVRLTNGIPDLGTLVTVTNNPNNAVTNLPWAAKDIAWDAAGNIYTLGWTNNYGVRVYSPGGTTLTVTANDTTGTNGTFTMTNFLPILTVAATQPLASEDGTTGTFTISRTGDTSAALTVSYSMSGTASNGTDYVTLSGTATIPAGASSVDVILTPIADLIPEPTETALMSLLSQPTYIVGSGPATVFISDATTPLLSISADVPSMYERFPTDYGSVQINRNLGNTNVQLILDASNFTYSGTAVLDSDFVVNSNLFPLVMDLGVRSATIHLVSPLDNSSYQGNRTIIVGLAPGSGFTVSNTTTPITILDDENPPAPVLLANPLTDPADATHWNITYGTGDETNFPANYNVDFGYDLTTDPTGLHGIISPPPGGATTALRITCNKLSTPGAAGGVNVYYTNRAFSGDYAVRFNLNLIQGYANKTEGVLFGINHTGTQSNWWWASGPIATNTTWGSDGVWYWVSSDPGGASAGDFIEYTGLGGTNGNTGWQRPAIKSWSAFTNVFKSPAIFTSVEGNYTGVPANGTPINGFSNTNWSDVEIKQVKNLVTLSIDKTTIFTYTNATVWTSGYLMLGYADPFGGTGGASVGTQDAAAYFSNLRVVQLTGPKITSLALNNTNVVIQFTSADGDDTISSFALQSSATANGTYTDVSPAATFTQDRSTGVFQTVYPQNGGTQFYRIRHK